MIIEPFLLGLVLVGGVIGYIALLGWSIQRDTPTIYILLLMVWFVPIMFIVLYEVGWIIGESMFGWQR